MFSSFVLYRSYTKMQQIVTVARSVLSWVWKNGLFLSLAVAAAALKLWLLDSQDLTYQGYSFHDEMLFVRLAHNIIESGWLGPYDNLTLAKGTFLPLFLVFNWALGLPLLVTQQLLYIAAVTAISWAIRPLIKNRFLLLFLFIILLFQPASFEGDSTARILRSSIGTSLSLFIFAGFFRLCLTKIRQVEAIWLGSLTGLALGLFWINREDNLWILPAVAILLGGKWVISFFRHQINKPLFTFSSAVLCWAVLPVFLVSLVNVHFYQIFTVTEFQHFAFPEAYGALLRVRPAQRYRYIPVTRSTRQILYKLSPAFKELEIPLEDHYASGWAENSVDLTGFKPREKQVAGGWWMWALRDAVNAAGYGSSGATAAAYYIRLTNEINALCDDGTLICTPPHKVMTPVLSVDDYRRIIPGFFELWIAYFSRQHLSVYNSHSSGTELDEYLFRSLTHEKLYHNEDYYFDDWNQATLKQKQLYVLEQLTRKYQTYALPFVLLGILSYIYIAIRRDQYAWVLLAIPASTLFLNLVVTIIHFTSFWAFGNVYLSPMYPLFLIFSFLSILRVPSHLRREWEFSPFNKTKPRILKKGFSDLVRVDPVSQN